LKVRIVFSRPSQFAPRPPPPAGSAVAPGLRSCEKLNKIDLTVNFIEESDLEESCTNLQQNEFLRDL
jgi:hypothetical protein